MSNGFAQTKSKLVISYIHSLVRIFKQIPKNTKLGLGGVIITFICAAGLSAVSLPWQGTVDSHAHLDYMYQVHNGKLPNPYGYSYQQNVPEFGPYDDMDSNRHLVASHPPLFYVIYSFFGGNLLENSKYEQAVVVGRAINIVFGILTIIALSYAGWLMGGNSSSRSLLSVSLPALAVLILPYTRVVGDIYNDPLVVLLVTVILTIDILLITKGPKKRYLLGLAFIAILGMLAKATFIAALLLSFACVAFSFLFKNTAVKSMRKNLLYIAGYIASVIFIVVISSGWFYFRNYQSSGSWFRSTPKVAIENRDFQSLADNLTNPRFYKVIPEGLLGLNRWRNIFPYNLELSFGIFTLASIGVILKIYQLKPLKNSTKNKDMLIISILMLLHVAALYCMQLQHAIGWGKINPRYFLTGIMPIGLFLSVGLLAWTKLRGLLVPALMIIFCLATIVNTGWLVNKRYPELVEGQGFWEILKTVVGENGFSELSLYVLFFGMAVGIYITGYSIFQSAKLATD